MGGRCYTIEVNPTSSSRVKVRLYETRPVRAGGNILLLQGQLSVQQFEVLEALLLAGAERDGTEFLRLGRYYSPGKGAASKSNAFGAGRSVRAVARAVSAGPVDPPMDRHHLVPWLAGPVIGPNGPMDDADDDYDTIARRHVERMLRRQRAGV